MGVSMLSKHRAIAAPAVLLMFLLGACTLTTRWGTITGTAEPCTAPTTNEARTDTIPVTVTLERSRKRVAHQVVIGRHIYRVLVPAGNYEVATREGRGSLPIQVRLRSGETKRVNILSDCP